MAVDTTSVNAKLDRGFEHLKALDELIRSFGDANPYVIDMDKLDDQGALWQARLVSFRDQPMSANAMGMVVGDCAHNFRAALDHVIVACAKETLSPSDFRKQEGRLQFPICSTEKAWLKAMSGHRIDGITGERFAMVEGYQPFITHAAPEYALLTVLAQLDDLDKHRLIHTIVTYAWPYGLPEFNPPITPQDYISWIPGPYTEPGAIFQFIFDPPRPDMNVNIALAVNIFVKDIARWEPIRSLLFKIGKKVQRLVVQIAQASAE